MKQTQERRQLDNRNRAFVSLISTFCTFIGTNESEKHKALLRCGAFLPWLTNNSSFFIN